jgi:hypothetical protein
VRPRGQATQLGPPVGDGAVGVGPRARGRGRLTASGGRTGEGANRTGSEKPTTDKVSRRFSTVVPVSGDRGGG